MFSAFPQYLKNLLRITRLLCISDFRKFACSVKKNDVCLDLGANVGDITLLMWFRGARVYSIEPSPIAFSLLQKRCKHLKRVTPLNLAVSDTNGHQPFYVSSNIQSSSLRSDKNNIISSDVDVIKVKCITLPSLLDYIGNTVTFVKCDIEGGEYFIQDDLIKLSREPTLRLMLIECHANKNPHWQHYHDSFSSKLLKNIVKNVDLTWH